MAHDGVEFSAAFERNGEGFTFANILTSFVDHVLVVDDGSADETAVRALMAGDDRLMLIRHLANRGVGAAIVTGYQHALRLSVDFVVVLAGDGQMDPGEIERLLEPLVLGHADYVKGNRLGHPELHLRMPVTRRWANRLLTQCTRWVVGDDNLNDSQCGYTAITRHALQRLPLSELWPRYGYPNDLLGLLREAGLRVVDRPVTPIYGEEVSGIRPLRVIPTLGYVLARAWLRRHVVS